MRSNRYYAFRRVMKQSGLPISIVALLVLLAGCHTTYRGAYVGTQQVANTRTVESESYAARVVQQPSAEQPVLTVQLRRKPVFRIQTAEQYQEMRKGSRTFGQVLAGAGIAGLIGTLVWDCQDNPTCEEGSDYKPSSEAGAALGVSVGVAALGFLVTQAIDTTAAPTGDLISVPEGQVRQQGESMPLAGVTFAAQVDGVSKRFTTDQQGRAGIHLVEDLGLDRSATARPISLALVSDRPQLATTLTLRPENWMTPYVRIADQTGTVYQRPSRQAREAGSYYEESEYRVTERRPGWLKVEHEQGEGWIPEQVGETFWATGRKVSGVDEVAPRTSIRRPDAVAVVIGIQEYRDPDIPSVDYALRDAQKVREHLVRTLGYRDENIIFEPNADGAVLSRIFGTSNNAQGQLYNYLRPGESEVFVYFSGHGAPDPESEKAYLMPANSDPDYLRLNGYPVEQLYENLAKLPARSVTVALEACFSGVSDGGAVITGISPALLRVENPVLAMPNGIAFTAGAANQVSTWYDARRHGLFTYFLLKGLRGDADLNGDQAVSASELGAYVQDEVSIRARRLHGREQTPQLIGRDQDRVLVQF